MDQLDRYDPDAFDFLGPPFAAPAGGDLLLTVPQEDALSATLNAVGGGAGLVLIAGDAGSGRTLVADALAAALRARGLVVDQIARLGGLGGGALLARLAPALGIAPGRLAPLLAAFAATSQEAGQEAGQADAEARDAAAPGLAAGRGGSGDGAGGGDAGVIDRGRAGAGRAAGAAPAAGQALGELAGEARPRGALAVVVDDAGTWPEADLLLLASMAGLRLGGAPLLQAVLIGDAALERRGAVLREAAARDGGPQAVSLRIPPLSLRQGEEYLASRFAAAGGSLQRTMSQGAIDEILLRCGGNPGRIDQLADDCLAITARRRRRYVTSTVVRTARQVPRGGRTLSGPGAYVLLAAAGCVLASTAGLALLAHRWTQPVASQADASRQATGQDDSTLFAGAGRFSVPAPATLPPATVAPQKAAPRPYTQDYPAQGFAPARPPVAVPPPPSRTRTALAAVPPAPLPDATTFPAPPAVPRVAASGAAVAPLATLPPPIALAPVPVAPPLPAVGTPPPPAVPSLAAAAPATIRTGGVLAVPVAVPPVLAPAPAWPQQADIAATPDVLAGRPPSSAVEAPPVRDAVQVPAPGAMAGVPLPLPPAEPARPTASRTAPLAVGRAPPARPDGPVVMHVAQRRDTAASLLRRIWGGDDATARALFVSLNPRIDAQGPWAAGTVVAVPQRRKAGAHDAAAAMPEPPRLPPVMRERPETVRDNPAGQVQSGVPYFCRSILPQNGAEDAYTRQVCGR